MDDQMILLTKDKGVFTLWLNRPKVRNAFNEEMILELIDDLTICAADEACQVLVLRGKGPSFCAGADLNWMKKAIDYDYQRNLEESNNLSKCLRLIYTFPKPTIALVHGAVYGGANGLLAACDFVLAETDTTFSMSEVRIGLIPACISPYVIKRVGEYNAKALMLTGKPFSEQEAVIRGLANYSGSDEELEKEYRELISQLMNAGPQAVFHCKKLIHDVVNSWSLDEAEIKTAELISEVRRSPEAQEGMSAFLEKRKPSWKARSR